MLVVLLFIFACRPEPVHAQPDTTLKAVGPKVQKIFVDGKYTAARFFPTAEFRDSSGTFVPITTQWQKIAGEVGVFNGDWIHKVDTTTGVFWTAFKGHWWGQELVSAIYYDDQLDDWTELGAATPGDWTVTGKQAVRDSIIPGVRATYRMTKIGAEEILRLKAGARNSLPAPSSFGYTNANTWFAWLYKIHDDSLNLKAKWIRYGNVGGFYTGMADSISSFGGSPFNKKINEDVLFVNNQGELIWALTAGIAREPLNASDALVIPESVQLTRYFIRKGGQTYMLVGAKVLDLNPLPAGAIDFDPTYTTPGTPGDCIMRGSAQHTNYYNLANNQWGSTSSTDKRRSIIRVPYEFHVDSGYIPHTPDSTIARGWFYNDCRGRDSTFNSYLAVFLRSSIGDPETSAASGYPDWVHRKHPTPNALQEWYQAGADSVDNCVSADCADRSDQVTTLATAYAEAEAWLEWKVPNRFDTLWHQAPEPQYEPGHIMLYGDENTRDNRCVASLNSTGDNGDSNFHFIVYWPTAPQILGGEQYID